MIPSPSQDRQLQQFIRKNNDLIVKWYQNDHLSWAVIAARLNQCHRGGGITASMLQQALPYLTRSRRVPALEVVAEDLDSSHRGTLAALEVRLQKQEDLIRFQSGRVQEAALRWARLEELVNQLVPLVAEARSSAERLPRNSPVADRVRASLAQLASVLDSSARDVPDERELEALAIAIAGLEELPFDA
ncbi:hypothetical protein [Gloeobacter morelensis]|uniref:Uncharacterized protein n=1 Tax=Gloeobacter morelensis MG652769 TaxID=2781736 RepID=A0ABY3PRC2_9CYAN|nr:hypothetical protein [Gloeobacter morelensis]UFP96268.1 hypothetical protein ISF26_08700 [Gloeobacter morelensis MG652769]